jgi:bacteriocin biosynthesis cyclodehydratase domain-containing protein
VGSGSQAASRKVVEPTASAVISGLPARPRLKLHLRAIAVAPDRTLLLGEGRQFLLNGDTYARVIPLLDGTRAAEEVLEQLRAEVPTSDVYYAMVALQANGHIEETDDRLPSEAAAYWSALGFDAATAAARLRDSWVQPVAAGEADCVALVEVLGEAGLNVRPALLCRDAARRLEGAACPWALMVVITDDYLRPELAMLNDAALSRRTPWLLLKADGIVPWVGPIFVPTETGCWACLAQRVEANREVEAYVQGISEGARPWPSPINLAASRRAAMSIAASEVARWLVAGARGQGSPLLGRLRSLDMSRMTLDEHVLSARPQCASCGEGGVLAPRRVVLERRPRAQSRDGGYRSEPPEVTLDRLRRHVSPITGVARGLFRSTAADDPLLHVYVTGQNLALRSGSLRQLRRLIRGGSCGKGISDVQAQVSGLAEAIERYSGVFRGEEPREASSLRRLGDRAVDPRSIMLYSEAQYKDRDRWNEYDTGLDLVPLPFDEDAEMDWSPVWSLSRGEFRLLPTSYLYYSYPTPETAFYCLPDSNGCAAGTSLEDAVLQGFLELIERDAVALWWYNRVRRPGVDLDSVDHPYVQQLRGRYQQLGRELWALDVTSDLGVPAMVALSRRVHDREEAILFAPAAHLDPEIALLRALTELNQMLPGNEPAVGGAGREYDDPAARAWWATATVGGHPYLQPSDIEPATRLDRGRPGGLTELRESVQFLQHLVEVRGLEVLVLDQTRPDIDVPVVKVIVPGLRHFWARFAPGRLYDVPVLLGWQALPTPEEGLNPISIFI